MRNLFISLASFLVINCPFGETAMADRPKVTFEGAVKMASHILVVSPDWLAKTNTKGAVSVEIIKIIHQRLDWTSKQLQDLHIPYIVERGVKKAKQSPEIAVGKKINIHLGSAPAPARLIVLIDSFASRDGTFECN